MSYFSYCSVSSDLVYEDKDLEERYRLVHTKGQRKLDIQFHYARCAAWVAVGLRMFKDSSAFQHYVAAIIVMLGAFTTLLPAMIPKYWVKKTERYVRWRPLVIFFDNVLQVVLGCYTHSNIYPETSTDWQDAPAWKAVAVFVTGSGFAWLNMSGLLGSLIFRFAMLQQTILTGIMMLASPTICQRSISLQKAFVTIHRSFGLLARRLVLPKLVYDGCQSWLTALNVSTTDSSSTHLVSTAANAILTNTTTFGTGSTAAGTVLHGFDGMGVCMAYQPISLLIFGLLIPTLYLYARELRSRIVFVHHCAVSAGLDPRDFVIDPMPTLTDYLMYAVPAVGALLAYIVSFGI